MAVSFYDRMPIKDDASITVKQTLDMNGETGCTWIPYPGKVLFCGFVKESGTGGGTLTWSGNTVTLAGWTNDEVFTLYARCGLNYAHPDL